MLMSQEVCPHPLLAHPCGDVCVKTSILKTSPLEPKTAGHGLEAETLAKHSPEDPKLGRKLPGNGLRVGGTTPLGTAVSSSASKNSKSPMTCHPPQEHVYSSPAPQQAGRGPRVCNSGKRGVRQSREG